MKKLIFQIFLKSYMKEKKIIRILQSNNSKKKKKELKTL